MPDLDMKLAIEQAHEMLCETIADRVVGLLNELLQLDREATEQLVFGHHIPCNQAFADHDSVQVREIELGKYGVRVMGLLNGLAGTYPDGYGRVGGRFSFNCPEHGEQDGKAGDPCPVTESEGVTDARVLCDKHLELHLIEFSRTPPEDHQVSPTSGIIQ